MRGAAKAILAKTGGQGHMQLRYWVTGMDVYGRNIRRREGRHALAGSVVI